MTSPFTSGLSNELTECLYVFNFSQYQIALIITKEGDSYTFHMGLDLSPFQVVDLQRGSLAFATEPTEVCGNTGFYWKGCWLDAYFVL